MQSVLAYALCHAWERRGLPSHMCAIRVTFRRQCRSFYPIKCRMQTVSCQENSPQTLFSSGELFQTAEEIAAIQGLLISQNTI